MKKNYLYMAALSLLAAACSSEDDSMLSGNKLAPEAKMITETITASNGDNSPVSRAYIADEDAAFTWGASDLIAVHVSDGQYYTTEALAEGEDGSTTAAFTISYPEGESRDAFAVFPASIVAADAENYGQEGEVLDVTLPASYTLAEVSGTTTPCPMIADNTGDSWEFKQLCGLLRLTVNCIPPSAEYLTIDFNGQKVQGDFSIASPVPGTSVIETSVTEGTDDIITITDLGISDWTDGMVLNIPLPTGSYTDITVTAYNSSNQAILTVTNDFSYSADRAKGRKVSASMPAFTVNDEGKKVVFAPGNLQYLGNADGTGTWRFAEHQYDFMGDGPNSESVHHGNVDYSDLGYTTYNTGSGSSTPTEADKKAARDLFGWGTSGYGQKPYLTSTNTGSYYKGDLADTNYDWGVYHSASGESTEKITNGGNYSWRLFTSAEWAYIIGREGKRYDKLNQHSRTTGVLFANATVVGVKGIILFPDNWDGSLDKTIQYGSFNGCNYNGTTCDAEKWALFEKQGCVFLPAADVRSGTKLNYVNEGKYWSSTGSWVLNNTEFRGGSLEFYSEGSVSTSSNVRRLGCSVRLIRDVE